MEKSKYMTYRSSAFKKYFSKNIFISLIFLISGFTHTLAQCPTGVSAGGNASICQTSKYSPTGTQTNADSVLWVSSGTGSFISEKTLTPTYTPSAADILAGSVTLTLYAYPDTNTCSNHNPVTSQMILTIVNSPTVTAPTDRTICASGFTSLIGTATNYDLATIQWTSTGTGVFGSPNSLSTTYTPSAADEAASPITLTLSVTGNAPCSNTISDNLVLTIVPEPTANAGPDATICAGNTYALSSAVVNNEDQITWSTSGTGTFNNIHVQNPTYTPSSADIALGTSIQLTVTATPISPCASSASDVMSLTIESNPTVDAGNNGSICETGSYTVSGASATNYASYAWSATPGGGTFTNSNSLTPTYTPSAADISAGSVTLTLTAQPTAPCASVVSDFLTITIEENPTANAGTDASICQGQTYLLGHSTVSNQASISWSTSGDGNFSSNTILHPVYTPGANDISSGSVVLTMDALPVLPCSSTVSDAMTLTIQAAPLVNAGANQTICSSGTASLIATASNYDLTSIHWSSVGGGTFSSTSVLTPTFTPSATQISNGYADLTIEVDGLSACSSTISDAIRINITPEPTANAGANTTICETGTYTISGASVSSQSSYSWSTSGDGTFTNPNSIAPTYHPGTTDITNGTVTITLTAQPIAPCGSAATDDLTITINRTPTVNAGANATICEGDTYNLNGAATHYASLLWSNNGGDGSFNDASLLNAIYTPGPTDISTGTVTLTLNANPIAPCSGTVSDNMVLTINSAPVINAGNDLTICASDAPNLNGTITGTYSSVSWSSLTGGTFSNNSITNPVYYPSAGEIIAGTATLRMTVTGNAPCNNTYTDDLVITITPLPTVNAGGDQTQCNLLPVSLTASATNYNAGSVLWSGGNGTFSSTNSLSTTYTPAAADLAAGTVILSVRVTGQNPCNVNVTDAMTLTLYDAVTVDAGPDQNICNGPYNLDATTTFASSLAWTTSGDGLFSSSTIEDPVYTPGAGDIAAGTVTLTLTAQPTAPCLGSTSDDVILTILTTPTASAGTDATVCASSPNYTLSGASVTGSGTILWTGGTGSFNNPADPNPTYSPSAGDIANGSVVLTLTVSNPPCPDVIDQMTLTIQAEPVVDAGNNLSVCTGNNAVITTASRSNTASVTWSSSGSGSFNNPNLVNPTYIPSAADYSAGSVTLTMSGTAVGPCAVAATDMMTVTFVPPPTANAGSNATICETSTFTFSTSSYTQASSIAWSTSGDGTFNDNGIQYPTYTPGSNDIITGSATLTLTAYSNAPCSIPATSSMVLSIESAPSADAGPPITICAGSTASLSGAIAADYLSLVWSTSGTGTFSNANVQNPVYTPSASDVALGNITLTLTANSNAPCATAAVDQMTLTITPTPIVNAGNDATICDNANYTLTGASAGNYSNIIWTTSGNGSFSNINDVNPTYTPGALDISMGSVTLTLTAIGISPCAGSVQDVMVLTIQDSPTVNAGADEDICEGSIYVTNPTVTDASSVHWSTTGDGVFANASMANTVYTPGANDIINGTVDLTLTANGTSPCSTTASNTLTLSIIQGPDVYAGPDEVICEGSFLVQNAVASNYSTLLWTSNGSSGTLTNQTTLTPTYTPSAADIAAGHVILTLTASPNAPCGTSASDQIRIDINENPTANAGANVTICESNSYTVIGATVSNQSSYVWSSSGTGTLINHVNNLTPTYSPSAADIAHGSVTLTLTAQPIAPCGIVATDQMIISIEPLPVVEAGSSASICQGSSYTIADATVSNATSVLWTSSGTGTFTDNSVVNATYHPSANDISLGGVQLTLTASSNSPCTSSISDVMDLDIQQLPTANAGTDPTICAGTSYTVSGATATNYSSISWSSSGSGTLTNSSSFTPTYVPSAADISIGSVTLTLSVQGLAPCSGTASDAIIITIAPRPTTYAGADQTICENSAYTIVDATASNYAGVQWTSTGSGTLTNASTLTPSYTPDAGDAANGTVVLRLTAQPLSPCTSPVFDEITFTVNAAPTASAGSNATICEGDTYTLTGASATNYQSILWSTSGTGIFSNAATVNPTYIPSAADYSAGSVDLTITVTGNAACGASPSDVMTLSFTPSPTSDAGLDASVCANATFTVSSASASNYTAINWTHNGTGSIINAGTLSPTYTPSAADAVTGTVTLTMNVTGLGNCAVISDAMILSIIPIPTVNSGPDATVCEGSTYSIINASAQNYNTITWSSTGTGSFSNSGIINPVYTPSSADLAAGIVLITLTASPNAPCSGDVSDSFALTFEPASIADAGPNATICQGNSYNLVGTSAQHSSAILWTTSGDGTFVNETTLNPTYTPGVNDILFGSATLTMNTTGNPPCGSDSDNMILTIQKLPTANAGNDASICEGSDFTVVSASASNYGTVSWTTSGDGTFLSGNSLTPVYTPGPNDITSGSVLLTLIASSNAPCLGQVSDFMNLTIVHDPTAYTGVDTTICYGDNYNPTNATATNYASLVWTTTGSGTFINNGTISPTYFPSGADLTTGNVVITLTANPLSPCATPATDAFILSFQEGPVVDAGASASICETGSYTNADATATDYNSLLWTTAGTGTFSDPTVLHTTYTPSALDISIGTVTLTLTATGNDPCPYASDYVTITILNNPTAYAGPMTEICSTPTVITGASATDFSALQWTTSGTGTFVNATTLSPTYTPSAAEVAAGTVTLTLTATPIGSCAIPATSSIVLAINEAATVFAGADALICYGSSYTIADATASNYSSLLWTTSGTGTFADPTVEQPIYTPSVDDGVLGAVTLTLTGSSTSCADQSDYMILTVNTLPTVYAGQDTAVCENDTYTVQDAIIHNYSSLSWSHNGHGTLTNATTLSPTYTPDPLDLGNTVTITVEATATAPCAGIISDALQLEVLYEPTANAGLDATICEDETYQVVGASASDYQRLSWSTSGTGTFINGGNLLPEYIPSTADISSGSVFLRLTAHNGPCIGVTDEMLLSFSYLPVIDAGNNATVDIGASYTVNSASASNYTSLSWSSSGTGTFVNGTSLTPTYTPSATDFANGSVHLTLTAIPTGVCSTPVTDYMILTVTDHPPVDFYWVSSCIGTNTEFFIDRTVTDTSTVATYAWDFGDGNTSNAKDPLHTYNTAGIFTVTLTITDISGYTNIVWHYVEVNPIPVANFNYSQPSCSELTTQFTDYSVAPSGYIVEWIWDFGDGSAPVRIVHPNNQNIEHTYANSGTFPASLTIKTSDSCVNAALVDIVVTASPIANFSYENACFGDLTLFTDESTNVDNIDIVEWNWDFGDLATGINNYSTEQNPVHRFLSTGVYIVSLTATNSNGCSNTTTDTVTIDVPPALEFNYSSACLDTTILFTVDTSITTVADINSWLWNFGDGTSSTEQNPGHTYATSGTYNVSLTALNNHGCSTTVSHLIEVFASPVANFDFSDPTCVGNMVQFTDYSNTPLGSTITEWVWIFGDGDTTTVVHPNDPDVSHLYDTTGTLTATLIITNSNGCQSSVSKEVVILPAPIAEFSFTTACMEELTTFTDLSQMNGGADIVSWTWDFGDPVTGANNSSTEQNPVHQFSNSGTFTVNLQIENSQGCIDTISHDVIVTRIPDVDFNFWEACLNTEVSFTIDSAITAVDSIATYLWDFGDGQSSNVQNPSHLYSVNGTYDVTLIVTDINGCSNSVSHELTLAPLPQSLFGMSESQCLSDSIYFSDFSTTEVGYIIEWIWDYGDGSIDTVSFPQPPNTYHVYAMDGIYTVRLTVTNSNGCNNFSEQEIEIMPGPIANFDFESVCLNVTADFTDLSQPNGGGQIVSWDWDFGDPTSGVDNYSTLQNPSHIFSTVGDHEVVLTVSNEKGCTSTANRIINISMLPEIDFLIVGGSCLDGATNFYIDTNVVDLTQIQSTLWNFGDGQSSNATQPTHIYNVAGTYEITLTIVDLNGCSNSITKEVFVDQLPDVKFDTDAPNCEGYETQFTDLSSRDNFIVEWHWDFGDGTDTIVSWPDDQNVGHIYPSSGIFLATLTIMTSDSCMNSAEKEIIITASPIANFAANSVCIDHPAQFTDLSQENGAGVIVDWYWDFGDPESGINNHSSRQNPVHEYAISGTYPVSLTITNAEGCSNTYQDSVIVTLPPPLDPFSFDEVICMNTAAQFRMSTNVNMADVQTILWNFGDPTSETNFSSEQNPEHIYENQGEYIVTLTLDNDQCGGSISDTIIVNSKPQAQFEISNTCVGNPTLFTDLSFYSDSPIESWSWDFGINNLLSDTSSLQHPVYTYRNTGDYYISLLVTDETGCSDLRDSVLIEIYPTPTADFSFIEGKFGTLAFTNESVDATEYLWSFGDGWVSDETDPIHQYDTSSYTYENLELVLISMNNSGCADTATQTYDLYFKGLYIPTAFSPNNPSEAVRIFKPMGVNLQEFQIEVYNSWGEMVWESSELDENGMPTEYWDGTLNGADSPSGVYIWRASGVFKDGTIWAGNEVGTENSGRGGTSGTLLLIR